MYIIIAAIILYLIYFRRKQVWPPVIRVYITNELPLSEIQAKFTELQLINDFVQAPDIIICHGSPTSAKQGGEIYKSKLHLKVVNSEKQETYHIYDEINLAQENNRYTCVLLKNGNYTYDSIKNENLFGLKVNTNSIGIVAITMNSYNKLQEINNLAEVLSLGSETVGIYSIVQRFRDNVTLEERLITHFGQELTSIPRLMEPFEVFTGVTRGYFSDASTSNYVLGYFTFAKK